jgi:hypothetical protein
MFVFTALLWLVFLGWAVHLWSIIDAALYRGKDEWARSEHRYYRNDYGRSYTGRRYYERGY